MGDNNNMISSSLNASLFDINYDFSVNTNGNSNIDNSDNHNHIPPSSSSDEISQFLRQILVRSSTTSAFSQSSSTPLTQRGPHPETKISSYPPSEAVFNQEISAVDFPHSGACFSGNPPAAHVSSSSVGASGNETDEYECESEEGVEAVVDEPTGKPAPLRSSSKRSRAAEVHNLSEKRRRSRINEKMKALQKLIPNSNKTDKASMLDEAIEYLKQLQLQVQMLTVRNGLNLHPMCLSGGALRPIQTTMNVGDHTNISPHVNMINVLHVDQHSQFANIPDTRNPGSSSFGLEPSFRCQFEPFPILNSSETFKVTNQGNTPPHNPIGINGSKTNLPGFEAGDIQADSVPFDAQTPNLS